jgi:hypothetical protein
MTILKKLGNATAVSDDGREVRVQFRLENIAYVENKHPLYIAMIRNNGQDRAFIKIDAATGLTNWLPPHAEEILTQGKKIEILDFVEKTLIFLDYCFEISNKPVLEK